MEMVVKKVVYGAGAGELVRGRHVRVQSRT